MRRVVDYLARQPVMFIQRHLLRTSYPRPLGPSVTFLVPGCPGDKAQLALDDRRLERAGGHSGWT